MTRAVVLARHPEGAVAEQDFEVDRDAGGRLSLPAIFVRVTE